MQLVFQFDKKDRKVFEDMLDTLQEMLEICPKEQDVFVRDTILTAFEAVLNVVNLKSVNYHGE